MLVSIITALRRLVYRIIGTRVARICIANVDSAELLPLLSRYFAGFTFQTGVGYWKGEAEPVNIVTCANTEHRRGFVNHVAEVANILCDRFGEQCAMVTVYRSRYPVCSRSIPLTSIWERIADAPYRFAHFVRSIPSRVRLIVIDIRYVIAIERNAFRYGFSLGGIRRSSPYVCGRDMEASRAYRIGFDIGNAYRLIRFSFHCLNVVTMGFGQEWRMARSDSRAIRSNNPTLRGYSKWFRVGILIAQVILVRSPIWRTVGTVTLFTLAAIAGGALGAVAEVYALLATVKLAQWTNEAVIGLSFVASLGARLPVSFTFDKRVLIVGHIRKVITGSYSVQCFTPGTVNGWIHAANISKEERTVTGRTGPRWRVMMLNNCLLNVTDSSGITTLATYGTLTKARNALMRDGAIVQRFKQLTERQAPTWIAFDSALRSITGRLFSCEPWLRTTVALCRNRVNGEQVGTVKRIGSLFHVRIDGADVRIKHARLSFVIDCDGLTEPNIVAVVSQTIKRNLHRQGYTVERND